MKTYIVEYSKRIYGGWMETWKEVRAESEEHARIKVLREGDLPRLVYEKRKVK